MERITNAELTDMHLSYEPLITMCETHSGCTPNGTPGAKLPATPLPACIRNCPTADLSSWIYMNMREEGKTANNKETVVDLVQASRDFNHVGRITPICTPIIPLMFIFLNFLLYKKNMFSPLILVLPCVLCRHYHAEKAFPTMYTYMITCYTDTRCRK
ncbi:hypothetical protein TNCV_3578271 [Trichonephila clavipes]|nr:hypothetical protein TNCV_3578271 [Trichonephila clavipes]